MLCCRNKRRTWVKVLNALLMHLQSSYNRHWHDALLCQPVRFDAEQSADAVAGGERNGIQARVDGVWPIADSLPNKRMLRSLLIVAVSCSAT